MMVIPLTIIISVNSLNVANDVLQNKRSNVFDHCTNVSRLIASCLALRSDENINGKHVYSKTMQHMR